MSIPPVMIPKVRKVQSSVAQSPLVEQPQTPRIIVERSVHISENEHIARDQAKTLLWKNLIVEQVKLNIKQERYDEITHLVDARYALAAQRLNEEKEKQETGSKISSKDLLGFFVTISPAHDLEDPIELMEEYAQRVTKLTGVSGYFYVYEQKGDTEETKGSHPHMHMLLERNVGVPSGERGKLKKQLNEIVRSVFKAKCNSKILEASISHRERFIKYMMKENTKDPISEEEKNMNKLWRLENGLKEYYIPSNGRDDGDNDDEESWDPSEEEDISV